MSNVDKKAADGEQPVRLVNYTDVYYGDRLSPSLDLMEASASTPQIRAFRLRPGDVAITKDSELVDDIGIAAYIEDSTDDMVLGYHLALLRPRAETLDGRYLYWAMCSDHVRGQLSTGATGVTRFGLRKDVIASTVVSAPTLAAQRAIADFLDTETARIDAVARRKGELAQKLLVRWTADLCATLLPGGLDSSAGRPIERRWAARPLRRLLAKSWGGDWGEEPGQSDTDLPCVRAADFDFGRLRATTGASRSFTQASVLTRGLRPGDLVIEKSGGGEGVPVGRVVAWRGDGQAVPTNFAGGLRPDTDVDPDFMLLALRAAYEVGLPWRSIKQTTGLQNLDLGHYLSHYWPVPSLADQKAIGSELLSDLDRVLAIQTKLRRQIELLQEHRQALVTAAVTGELDVDGEAA